jgi:hypothetical protein
LVKDGDGRVDVEDNVQIERRVVLFKVEELLDVVENTTVFHGTS